MKAFLSVSSIILLLFFFSCERISSVVDSPIEIKDRNLISEAKTYFENSLTFSASFSASARKASEADWYNKRQPIWEKAITYKSDSRDVVEVNLLMEGQNPVYSYQNSSFENIKTINKNGLTKALMFRQKDGRIDPYLAKIIFDDDYFKSINGKSEGVSINSLGDRFSGVVIISDWNNNTLSEYIYNDGNMVATTRNDSPSNTSKNARNCAPTCGNVCVGVSLQCCTMEADPNSYCCRTTVANHCYVQCYYTCYPSTPTAPPTPPIPPLPSISNPTFTGSYTYNVDSDPIKMRIFKLTGTVTVANRCQHQALRNYLMKAQSLEIDYVNKVRQCAIQNNISGDAIEKLLIGVSFASIAEFMAANTVATFRTAARGIIYGQMINNMNTNSCIINVQNDIDAEIEKAHNEYQDLYYTPC